MQHSDIYIYAYMTIWLYVYLCIYDYICIYIILHIADAFSVHIFIIWYFIHSFWTSVVNDIFSASAPTNAFSRSNRVLDTLMEVPSQGCPWIAADNLPYNSYKSSRGKFDEVQEVIMYFVHRCLKSSISGCKSGVVNASATIVSQ